LRTDRHLVRAQHSIAIEELDDFELFEARIRSLISVCEARFGSETCSFSEFIDRLMDEEEASQEEPPAQYRHMLPLPDAARGNRAPAWRRIEKPNPQFTKGETERFLLAEPGDLGDRLRLGKH